MLIPFFLKRNKDFRDPQEYCLRYLYIELKLQGGDIILGRTFLILFLKILDVIL